MCVRREGKVAATPSCVHVLLLLLLMPLLLLLLLLLFCTLLALQLRGQGGHEACAPQVSDLRAESVRER